jgi:hypothetical protein
VINPSLHRELARHSHADAIRRAERERLVPKSERHLPSVSFSKPLARLSFLRGLGRRPTPAH